METLGQISDLFLISYLPSTWSKIFEAFQNLVDLTASLFSLCQFEKVLNTVNSILTVQGATAAGTRLLASLINEIPDLIQRYIDSQTVFTSGVVIGELLQIAFNYSIS
mmetsp:Transcript_13011/g.9415  ORF Transcript_13011/g.9415 Transcript_13011/m.9415 type:complete len:108 (+) Transcript_13011:411-734(+)